MHNRAEPREGVARPYTQPPEHEVRVIIVHNFNHDRVNYGLKNSRRDGPCLFVYEEWFLFRAVIIYFSLGTQTSIQNSEHIHIGKESRIYKIKGRVDPVLFLPLFIEHIYTFVLVYL
jgi:hypothetical protein